MPSYQMEKLISSLKIICAKEVQDDDKSQKTDDEDTVYTIETFLCGWALGSKSVHDIKDGNIYSFLAWAFCSISLDDAKKDLKKGDMLDGEGGFCARGRLVTSEKSKKEEILPLGLTDNAVLKRDVSKDSIIKLKDVELNLPEEVVEAREYQYNIIK